MRLGDGFPDSKVEPLGHIVLNEFFYQVAQMSLAEDDEVIETLVLDGLYKALRVWIAIWTLRRNLHALHASRFQNRDERLGEQRISIVDQVLRATKKPINRICQISCHLLHPRFAWVNGNPGDLNGPTLELDDEEHHVPNRAEWPQGFHAEEIAGVERVQWLFMNCFQVRFLSRSGAGSIPSSSRMLATVVRPISIFNPVRRASRIFVYPQPRFARAIAITSLRMSFFFRGRPTFFFELSYFCAAIWRNHPKSVPGFTIWQHFFRASGLKALPATARRRRWSAVNTILSLPVAAFSMSLRTRTSS